MGTQEICIVLVTKPLEETGGQVGTGKGSFLGPYFGFG
jgi:hypothetical protein